MIKYKLLCPAMFLIAMLFSGAVYGQNQISVKGTVLDSKTREPLIGVTVREKGVSNGTVTNLDGKFVLQTASGAVLVFSYTGYDNKEMAANANAEMSVLLDEKTEVLNEVVVVGYGVQKKSDITGSISSVSAKEINNVPVASALQALQGRASGVNIIQNSGAPGGGTTIKIRGTGTVNDADPLYVVDGFIVDEINHINPNDIANIEIFKDAASSAIYGARGANGVVVITTKTGEEGTMRVTFDAYAGISNPWKTIPVMNLEDYALMRDYTANQHNYSVDGRLYYSKNDAQEYYFNDAIHYVLDTLSRNSIDNWWDAVTQTGVKQQYNLSVSGGSGKSKYMVSASYYNEEGIVKTSEYRRFNARMNLNSQLTSWLNLTTNMAFTNENRNIVPDGQNGILKRALYQNPMIYTYNDRGYWSEAHPLAIIDRNHNQRERYRIDMNMSLTAQILKLLTYQFRISNFVSLDNRSRFTEINKPDEDFIMTDLSTVDERRNLTNKWEINNLLTFAWNNNKAHDITLLGGQILEGYMQSPLEAIRRGTASNDAYLQYLSSAYTGDKTYGLERNWSAVGFVGRINYNVLDRYLFQANFRADASSIFSKANRWGYFPSVSVGWKFTSEPFMQSATEWLSFGKLRFGWGQLGNNRIDELARYTILNMQYNYSYGVGSHVIQPGIIATVIGNPDIRWEKTETVNAGIDLGFFNNSLNISAEVFDKKTTDMLLRVPVLISAGMNGAPMTNAGSVRNRGGELLINHKNTINRFRYEIGFNISYIQNEVTGLGTGNEPVYGAYLEEEQIVDFVTKTVVGRPIGGFFGYVTDGIFNTFEEVQQSPQYEPGKSQLEQTTLPGDFRFKDLNSDGRITAEDRTYLGSPLPDFVFGIPLMFSYANWDLNLFFQGQTGNKIFNVMEYYLNSARGGNVYADLRDRHWSGQVEGLGREFFQLNTDNATIPDLRNNNNARNFRASDFFVKDGSYLRMQEVRLSYNFNKSVTARLHLTDLAVYAGAYNLLTFTRYTGFDPEVGKISETEGNNLNMGVDHGNYPQARSFNIGVKITM